MSPVPRRRRGENGSLFLIRPTAKQHSFPRGEERDANGSLSLAVPSRSDFCKPPADRRQC